MYGICTVCVCVSLLHLRCWFVWCLAACHRYVVYTVWWCGSLSFVVCILCGVESCNEFGVLWLVYWVVV